MADRSPATQAAITAFDERYERTGPFELWEEVSLAAALRALADHRSPPLGDGPLCHWNPDERTRQELRNIADELEMTDG